jgi:hypothetical protein
MTASAAAAWPIRGASADVAGVTPAGKETVVTTRHLAALDDRFKGEILKSGDAPYEDVRQLWNGSFDRRPALIARCTDANDVAATVTFARERDILTAVRAGGHSYSGQSSVDDGLMIDLQPMKQLTIDPEARVATCGAGVFLGEFDRAAQAYGLATTAGTVPHTGIAGLTLGGGVGRLMRLYGMTIDNLIAAEMVTGEGKLIRASETQNPDLFWGLRGGAGNFGVVTSFQYRLHQVGPDVQTFSFRFPIEQARRVMRDFFEYTAAMPDRIHTTGSISSGADGTITANIGGTHYGTVADAEKLLAPIAKFGTAISSRMQTVKYVDVQQGGPNPSPHGMGHYSTGGYTGIDPAMVDPAVDRFLADPLPGVSVSFFALGGATGRIANETTAFAHRDALFSVSVSSNWPDPRGLGQGQGEQVMSWCRETWKILRPFGDGGYYANLTSDTSEKAVRENYRGNYDRLVALKTKYDPTNFFRQNANIRPKAA